MPVKRFDPANVAFSRRAAAEGFVLLKNDGALPLDGGKAVALFGRTQFDTWKGGYGSADLWAVPVLPFADGMNEAGSVYKPLLEKYRRFCSSNRTGKPNRHWDKWTDSLPEMPLEKEDVTEAAGVCDTAVVFIGRCAGENRDWQDVPGQYRLSEAEEKMLDLVTSAFRKTVLVFNIPGLMDISFLNRYPVNAVLHTFLPGMEAGHALADVLYGLVNPGGRLPDSWAEALSDYPTSNGFGCDKIVYSEGLYIGYRYFDSFGKKTVFPFGFGLSYTDFSMEVQTLRLSDITALRLNVKVTNTGSRSGREVVQCYISPPQDGLEKPYQSLCGFEKTGNLMPGASQTVIITVDMRDFSSYSEKDAAYVLEKGDYIIRVGKDSQRTEPVCVIRLTFDFVCRKVKNRLTPPESINLLHREPKKLPYGQTAVYTPELAGTETVYADSDTYAGSGIEAEARAFTDGGITEKSRTDTDFVFSDVVAGRCEAGVLAEQLTDEENVLMLSGDCNEKRAFAGLPPEDKLISGEGTHSHIVKRLGIPSTVMQDGPAGIRLCDFSATDDSTVNGQDCISYPSPTLIAASWDKALAKELGSHIAADMDRYGLAGWCAPGVNLHRCPLNGRNFEYFSEDPFLSAQIAIGEIEGVQLNPDGTESGRYAILKHFACNESETKRKKSDSVLTERTARELYLRCFDYVIHYGKPLAVMTSYNKINGIYAAERYDLCTGICRFEWSFDGLIMTDWHIQSSPVACINAGNNIVMPGSNFTIDDLTSGRLDRSAALRATEYLIKLLTRTRTLNAPPHN